MKKQIISAALAAVISAGYSSAPFSGTSEHLRSLSRLKPFQRRRLPESPEPIPAPNADCETHSGQRLADLLQHRGSYKLYTKTLKITKNTTLKFYAQKNGAKSKTVTVKYKLTPKVKVTNAYGNYDSAVTVKLSSTASGVKFYYTRRQQAYQILRALHHQRESLSASPQNCACSLQRPGGRENILPRNTL